MSDESGKEELALRAAKDLRSAVAGDTHSECLGEVRESVGKDRFTEIVGNDVSSCSGDISQRVGGSYSIACKKEYVIEAERLSFKIGGSTLVMDGNGIWEVAKMIGLNSGGPSPSQADRAEIKNPDATTKKVVVR